MESYETEQVAYLGLYALKGIGGLLLSGGGVVARRPRLYFTEKAAKEAAKSITWCKASPVRLSYTGSR